VDRGDRGAAGIQEARSIEYRRRASAGLGGARRRGPGGANFLFFDYVGCLFRQKHREANFTFTPTHCDPLICFIGDLTNLLHITVLPFAEDSTARSYTAALPATSFCAWQRTKILAHTRCTPMKAIRLHWMVMVRIFICNPNENSQLLLKMHNHD
jgi:hypothetical protein